MINAAKRDQRVVFQRLTRARSALGVRDEQSWSDLGSRFAWVRFGSGAERRAAAGSAGNDVESGVKTATFRVLADTLTRTVTVQDRIVHGGLAYDIADITPIGQRPTEIEFTGTASRG